MKCLFTTLCALCAIIATGSAKTLVVYYSYTGNARAIATELTRQISADVLEIQPAEKGLKYEANNYAIGTQLLDAIKANPNNAASYPAIDPVTVSVSDYSTVIIVTPLWWSRMAAIMQTYLFQVGADLAGKNVGLIVTSASSSISGVVADCKRLVPDADYLSENLWINNSNRSNMPTLVANWVETCGLNQNDNTAMSINVIVGNKTFTATLADSETGKAFAQLLPMTLSMNELNGNEKYHYLDSSLPTDSYTPGTIQAGDLMLYGNNCVVLFYKTFSSSYSYTRIGRIDNPAGLAEALGSGNVSVRFEQAETTDLSTSVQTDELPSAKVIENGQVYIQYKGQVYDVRGQQIR
ncbi:MAG: hypothetical protein II970_08465 [Paludibacteraceae bacterium]|nr:hypothetical protein [Paludibacteraceae bacterium]